MVRRIAAISSQLCVVGGEIKKCLNGCCSDPLEDIFCCNEPIIVALAPSEITLP